ncbi:MAG: universal stress protein [Thermoproteus sp. AZ2]|jgi:nucleotide-binding universal stress UspA family protein|uniref:Universal stress protein n=1 Tax=Thermoproteus sp. AZ2 TaxID=1609232 RepID=A0ACC6UYH5_9CREN|nr:MAG: universal stress protein [Thermoproteus sp. AZ2]
MKTIVVGFDGSQQAHKALNTAKELAEKLGAKIYIVYVVDTAIFSLSEAFSTPTIAKSLREEGEKLLREAKSAVPSAEVKLLEGDPSHEIAAFAKSVGADLIVVGSRGLSTIRRSLLGSVAGRLVQEAEASVLVVK